MTSAMATEGFEGKVNVCHILTVKPELEKECDEMWGKGKKFLKETQGPWGLVGNTVAKNKEPKNALDPRPGVHRPHGVRRVGVLRDASWPR